MKKLRRIRKIKKNLKKKFKGIFSGFEIPMKESDAKIESVLFSFLVVFSMAFMMIVWVGVTLNGRVEKEVAQVPPSPLEIKMSELVIGHPLEEMTPFIADQNEEVAKYLFAISKKESNWGKLSPQKDGETCYNYWGYRGSYNQTDSGYSCFDTPAQAVKVVGRRIKELIKQGIDTPQDMIVWKCGRSCAGHGDSAQKWIDDVEFYYQKL